MGFCSIVIRGRKLALIGAAIIGAAALTAGAVWVSRQGAAETVFNEDSTKYEELLKEGLIDSEQHSISVKDALNKLLGFDTDKPQTIIGEYSAMFKTAADETAKADEAHTEQATQSQAPDKTEKTDKADKTENPSYPTKEEMYTAKNIEVNNATSYSVDPEALCAQELSFEINKDEPQILIVHTHTTECYDGDNMYGETERNTDETKNVAAIGKVMKEVFESKGIKCIQDTTVHDYPTYQGAYTRELATIEKNLEKYPSIKLIFDVHRDAYIYPDGSKLKVECEQNGVSTAKAMIVCGTDAMGLDNPNWRENFKLAVKIQNAAERMYPGLMRPINLRQERFNMHMRTGSLLFEVGSNGNTLAQAIESAKCLANSVCAVLTIH